MEIEKLLKALRNSHRLVVTRHNKKLKKGSGENGTNLSNKNSKILQINR
jgi:hypothetical protein